MTTYVRRATLGILVAVAVIVANAAAALAQTGDASPDAPVGSLFTINNTLVTILLGTVAPLVAGLLLRESNPRWVKTLVAGLVATGFHWLSQIVQDDGSAVISQEWVLGLAATWIAMIAAYYGLWKPTIAPNSSEPTVIPIGDAVARIGGSSPGDQRAA